MLRALYVVNASLLVAHEIDAAAWREWELFSLPGGAPAFVALHLALVPVVLWGHGRLVAGARAGLVASVALALAGLAAGAIHGAFLAGGDPAFRAPLSLAVLAGAALVSVAQGALAVRALRRAATAPLSRGGAGAAAG